MDLFELSATLGLDTSGFVSGLTGALKWALGAVWDFGKDVVETGMGFDREMSAVQAVLGKVEGTATNMERLRETALDEARDSIFTAEETAKAYYYMGMAGWKTEQMLAGLPGIMALAASSGEDLAKVSDVVTDSITAFGLTADDVSEYVDILAQTATNANTDVKRMGETFKYIAPIAGSLGADYKDVALAIGLLADAGIKGSQAGTALRNIFTRLSTNAGATSKDLGALDILTEKLGVQFWDASGKMRDFSDIIMEARQAWKGLTQEEQVYYAKQIGSQRGMAAWLQLMNATDAEVQKLQKSYENATGAAQAMADTRLDNLQGDLEMLNSSMDVLKVTLFDGVKAPMRDLVQYATGAVDRIRDAIVKDGFHGGIQQLGQEIRDFGKEYEDDIRALAQSLVPIITDIATEIIPPVAEACGRLGIGAAGGFIQGIADEIDNALGNPGPWLAQAVDWVENFVKGIGNGVVNFGPTVAQWFDTLVQSFKDAAKNALDWGKDLIDNFVDGIKRKWGDLKDTVRGVADTVKSFLGFSEPEMGPLSDFHTYAPDMMKLFAQGIRENAGLITDAVDSAFNLRPAIANSQTGGQEYRVPRDTTLNVGGAVMEVDRMVFAKLIFKLYNEEAARVGVKLAGVNV